jgi:fido (protein-threonine AMPylation protein)
MAYETSLVELINAINLNPKVWFEKYDHAYEDILKNIHVAVEKLTNRRIHEDDEEIMKCIQSDYLREIWISENPTHLSSNETIEVVTVLFEQETKPETCPDEEWTQLVNLKSALEYLNFNSSLPTQAQLTLELIYETHRLVAQNLIADGGTLRNVFVGASNTSITYARPTQILPMLKILIKFVNKQFEREINLEHALKVGTVFFAEFLKIHPFKDGNGRTARLLLNYLLKGFAIVPFSLYMNVENQRILYLNLIEEAQWNKNPSPLAKYLLHSAHRKSQQACFLLLSEISE